MSSLHPGQDEDKKDLRMVACEPRLSTLTQRLYAYDFGDTVAWPRDQD